MAKTPILTYHSDGSTSSPLKPGKMYLSTKGKSFMKMPETTKLVRSAGICAVAVLSVVILKTLFSSFDFAQYETAILTALMAFLVSTVREATK